MLAGVIMSAKAKQNRDEWETKLIACKESLVQVSQKIPLNKRSVTKKLAELLNREAYQQALSFEQIY